MTENAVWLKDRGVIRASGPDAADFLQGVLTNDVDDLPAGEARYAALLTPQGKILFDLLATRLPGDGGFLIDCAAEQAPAIVKRLSFYRLRAKVEIVDESADRGVLAYLGEAPENAPGAIVYADPRAPQLGHREILPLAKAIAIGEGRREDYDALRISLGVPQGGVDFAYGDVFPHDANLDLLHGVDFRKGCYVGQEVVSRMQHRGGIRKRVVRVLLQGGAPQAGAAIVDGDLPVGSLGSSFGHEALALVRLDRAEDARAAGRALMTEGIRLTLL